jgi:DNA-binding transcriptional LysR family regulator
MHVALPAGHTLASKDQLTLEDLQDEAWVQTSASSACARHVVRLCHAAGFDPIVSFESDDYQTVQGLVAAGVGVALIPELALTGVRDEIVVRSLVQPKPMRRVVAATSRGAGIAPAAGEMLKLLQQVAADYTSG